MIMLAFAGNAIVNMIKTDLIQVKMSNEQHNIFARDGGRLRHGSLFSGI